MPRTLYLAAAVLALSACGTHDNGSNAQDLQSEGAVDKAGTVDDPGVAQAEAQPSDNTNIYVSQAAIGDLFEIQSSQLALKKAQSAEVKAFAKQMIADHTATTAQLKTLASLQEVGRALPTQVDAPHKAMLDQLNAVSGAAFDKAYLDQQARAHQEALLLHADYADKGTVSAVKSFAQTVTPKIQHHADMVKQLQASLAGGAR
ncbi:DUF4142 domain-containing protein [Novosphingobium sp. 9U]|uniref:DUF4142 domain-containing protein n=1 Tax=Novosphingobium sp. 9U TaxID=2653158 RepID=UPI0012F23052|nr:DUF4142 domain-containing protein [Novosphingobium sp. 9U]VWX47249.1 conserved hypothetical protein [Novosphingobium sp. 9U]